MKELAAEYTSASFSFPKHEKEYKGVPQPRIQLSNYVALIGPLIADAAPATLSVATSVPLHASGTAESKKGSRLIESSAGHSED